MKTLGDRYTLLAVESSAGPASAAVVRVEEGTVRLLCSTEVLTKLTHSQTLLPMIADMLRNAGLAVDEIDALAVSVGPGSFTGIRIGVSAVKGLAFAHDLPCIPVSTLAAMAARMEGMPGLGGLLTAMDARCGQIYTARFESAENGLRRVTPDEALPLEEVKKMLISEKKSILVVGDGAEVCYNSLKDDAPCLQLAPVGWRTQHAIGVAREAVRLLSAGFEPISGESLLPTYLRLPQAERELRMRQQAAQTQA